VYCRDRTVRCEGLPGAGFDGDMGAYPALLVGAPVKGFTDVAQLDVGTHTCAVTATGELLRMGRNDQGQVGDGTTDFRKAPTRVIFP
jgi:alpha-tubulin suppressor-like RCC1 family protein